MGRISHTRPCLPAVEPTASGWLVLHGPPRTQPKAKQPMLLPPAGCIQPVSRASSLLSDATKESNRQRTEPRACLLRVAAWVPVEQKAGEQPALLRAVRPACQSPHGKLHRLKGALHIPPRVLATERKEGPTRCFPNAHLRDLAISSSIKRIRNHPAAASVFSISLYLICLLLRPTTHAASHRSRGRNKPAQALAILVVSGYNSCIASS